MRKRLGRKSRSNMVLDLRQLYVTGVTTDIFRPFDDSLALNDAEFEIQFCEEILRNDPSHFEALVLLGDAYSRVGQYHKGLDLDLKLVKLKPDDEVLRYNLACSYVLTGQIEKALRSLDKAIKLGYRDADKLRQDKDLDPLRSDPRFQALVQKLIEEQAVNNQSKV